MNEANARRLLLVRAIESDDAGEVVLTREDRQHASHAALAQGAPTPINGAASSELSADEEAFLVRRAAVAVQRIEARYPQVKHVGNTTRWPRWLSWLLPAAAFVIGAATNELSASQRINIIAFPLLGLLAWNLAIYAWLIGDTLLSLFSTSRAGSLPRGLTRLLSRLAQPARERFAENPPLARGLTRFVADWLRFSSSLTDHRARRALHLSAALFAAGIVAGMYVRALGFEYRAGWESTFIDAGTLYRILGFVLGPASALTGIALPGPEHLAALRWNPTQPGENAARWIHLYATTAVLFIIAPRLLLSLWHAVRASYLGRKFPLPDKSDAYLRRLLMAAQGKAGTVWVIPYSFHPGARVRDQLGALLANVLGEKTRMEVQAPIAYGDEDEYLEAGRIEPREPDHVLILFNLAATPESENHGALVAGIRQMLKQRNAANPMLVMLDESAYRQRLAGQAEAAQRIDARRRAWETMLRPYGVTPLSIDLETGDLGPATNLLEAAFRQHSISAEPS